MLFNRSKTATYPHLFHPFCLQVALPELDGALEPIVFAGRDSNTGKSHSLPDRIESLAARAINWAKLRKKKNADKKLAITGAIGGCAHACRGVVPLVWAVVIRCRSAASSCNRIC